MYLELRARQIEACREAVGHHSGPMAELFAYYFGQRRSVTQTVSIIGMPAIGWRALADLLSTELYLPGGRTNGKARPAMRSALKQVSRAVIMREAHPGLKAGGGAAGHVMDIIPAWDPGGIFSPYPNGHPFVMLWPEWHKTGGVAFTTWTPQVRTFWGGRDIFDDPTKHTEFLELHNKLVEPALDRFLSES